MKHPYRNYLEKDRFAYFGGVYEQEPFCPSVYDPLANLLN